MVLHHRPLLVTPTLTRPRQGAGTFVQVLISEISHTHNQSAGRESRVTAERSNSPSCPVRLPAASTIPQTRGPPPSAATAAPDAPNRPPSRAYRQATPGPPQTSQCDDGNRGAAASAPHRSHASRSPYSSG